MAARDYVRSSLNNASGSKKLRFFSIGAFIVLVFALVEGGLLLHNVNSRNECCPQDPANDGVKTFAIFVLVAISVIGFLLILIFIWERDALFGLTMQLDYQSSAAELESFDPLKVPTSSAAFSSPFSVDPDALESVSGQSANTVTSPTMYGGYGDDRPINFDF